MALAYEVLPSVVEDTIIAALKADPVLGAALASVTSFRTQAHGQLLKASGRQLPLAAVVYGGGDYQPLSQGRRVHIAQFAVLLYTENLRAEKASRGDAYSILERLPVVLVGETLGLDIDHFELEQIELLSLAEDVRRGVTVYQATFSTRIAMLEVESTVDLEAIHGAMTTPAGAQLTAQTETTP